MGTARDRIEQLLKDMERFRESPKKSGFTDADHLLTHVENVLEDCMTEFLDLPIEVHRPLLDRLITSVEKVGKVGDAFAKILNLFFG